MNRIRIHRFNSGYSVRSYAVKCMTVAGLIFMLLLVMTKSPECQVVYDSRIDSIVNLISKQRIIKYNRELSGDTVAVIGGSPRLIYSRYYLSPSNEYAMQYIFEKFQSFGLYTYIQIIDSTCRNVIAVKTGSKYPNRKYIIGAHYDNILWPVPGPYDTVHGADDNASGVCGVLEAAKLLAGMDVDYTVVFAAWDQEENNPVWGAGHYADSLYAVNDSVMGYINLDMIAYNMDQNKFWAGPDSSSYYLFNIFSGFCSRYIPSYKLIFYYAENYGSDHLAFLRKHYKSFSVGEFNAMSNPNFHKITDTYSNADMDHLVSLLRPSLGMLTAFALNKTVYFSHKAPANSYDTASRIATITVNMPEKTCTGPNSPRLYYRINNETGYSYINSYYSNRDTFRFLIPGKPAGSIVRYYFAAQDTIENYACTYPSGGSGANPPGTVPPASYFMYQIFGDYSICSSTLPKQIPDLQLTKDTITVNTWGNVEKIKVNLSLNHQNDGDLIIQLLIPGYGTVNLSQRNGEGGQNFINTTFDDDAAISITQGTPPFTGSYRPVTSLRTFFGVPLTGSWLLKITDAAAGNQGTLNNWCLIFKTRNMVSAGVEQTPVSFGLSQNYPNPFNSSTRIMYSLNSNSDVSLKIYDILGREVRTLADEFQEAGNYAVMFNPENLPGGVYFYILTSGNMREIKKMIIVK